MGKLITSSSAERAMVCLAPWAPDAEWTDSKGLAALRGDAFHACADGAIKGLMPMPAQVLHSLGIPKERAWLERRLAGFLQRVKPGPHWRSEVAYAFDPEAGTARELQLPAPRAYEAAGALPHEICGTADVVFRTSTKVVVFDWKTGRSDYVTAARSNAQIRLLSLCAALVYGMDHVRAGLVFIGSRGEPMPDVTEFGPTDLDVIAAELGEVHARRMAGEFAPRPHPKVCAWCPMRQCSARAA